MNFSSNFSNFPENFLENDKMESNNELNFGNFDSFLKSNIYPDFSDFDEDIFKGHHSFTEPFYTTTDSLLGEKTNRQSEIPANIPKNRKHTRKTKDLIGNKLLVFFRKSALSFFNSIFKLFESEKDEFLIRKLEKKIEPKPVDEKGIKRKKRKNLCDILLMPEKDFPLKLNTKLYDYFSRPISTKYGKVSKEDQNVNKENFDKFFNSCQDQELLSILKNLTVSEFYQRVFLNEENILPIKYSNIYNSILTLNKLIDTKKSGDKTQGFEDSDYLNIFKSFAEYY